MLKLLIIIVSLLNFSCAKLEVQDKEENKEEKQEVYQAQVTLEGSVSGADIISELKKVEDKMRKVGNHALLYFASDLYLKAARASIEGDVMLGHALFKYLHELYPNDLFLHERLALSLIRIGKLSEAKEHLKDIFQSSHLKNEKIGLLLAGVYGALMDRSKARDVYSKLLKSNPENEEACLYLAQSYEEEEKYDKALGILDGCEKQTKNHHLFSFHKGMLEKNRGNTKRALIFFKKAKFYDKDNENAYLEIGKIYEEEENWDKAFDIYNEYCQRDPTHPEVLRKIIKVLFLSDEFEKTIPYLKILTQMEPDNLNLKVKLGILYTDSEQYNEAEKIFLDILKVIPNSDKVLFYLGSIYAVKKDFKKAFESFHKITKESSFFQESTIQSGKILSYLVLVNQEDEDTLESFVEERSKIVSSLVVELKTLLATYYDSKGNYQKAIDLLVSLRNEKEFEESHEYYLATLYEKIFQYDRSREIALSIVEKNPKHAHAWNFLGYSYLEDGDDFDKAYQYIQKAIELSPNDAFIRDSLGWYYFKIGQTKKALKEVKYAYSQVEDDVVICKHLAIIYQKLGRKKLARKYYVDALSLSRSDKEKDEINSSINFLDREEQSSPSISIDSH